MSSSARAREVTRVVCLIGAAVLGTACTSADVPAPAQGGAGSTSGAGASGAGSTSGAGASGAAGSGGGASDAGADTGAVAATSVLFIGNSYTYVNDLPGHVHELAATAGVPPTIDVGSVVAPGASFYVHWTGAEAQPAIAQGDHTHVVLQGQSNEPLAAPAAFDEYGTLLVEAAKAAGAQPVLFETWAQEAQSTIYDPMNGGAPFGTTPDAMQDGLSAAYEALASDTGASLAPVGEAWRIAWTEHPEIELYQADHAHPGPAGAYLSACVFYIVLTGQPLAAASDVPADVAPGDAAALRAIATQATAAR